MVLIMISLSADNGLVFEVGRAATNLLICSPTLFLRVIPSDLLR